MSTNTLVLDATAAQAEIDRRLAPKNTPEREVANTPEAQVCKGMSGAALATLANLSRPAPKKAKATKAAKPAKPARVVDPHTALRKQAWEWRNAEFHAGRKVTTDEAYAKFGTQRATPKEA